jgi:hypothetical protein
MASAQPAKLWDSKTLFAIFKYTIYTLLCCNVFFFFRQEWSAAVYTFSGAVGVNQLGEAFAATIDTASWVVLLLMFELETWVLRKHKIEGALSWTLNGVAAVCYALILYSFWGYIVKLYVLFGYAPVELPDPCGLVNGDVGLAVDLDEYVALDSTNCRALANAQLYQLDVRPIFAERASVTAQLWLAWVDVFNAAAWLGVVVVLEADVWCQQRGVESARYAVFSKLSKVILYGTLLLAAAYWGFRGDFVDVWDAVLWILAFVFIEMNFFEWQEELAQSCPSSAVV